MSLKSFKEPESRIPGKARVVRKKLEKKIEALEEQKQKKGKKRRKNNG